MTNRLRVIFKHQEGLMRRLGIERNYENIRTCFTAAVVELSEFMQEINWKPWKNTKKDENRAKILEELVDVLHFYVELCILMGFDSEEIFHAYEAKMEVNHKRQDVKY